MKSYRLARRSFFTAIGGAFGLQAILKNMEASAQGAGAPPRFLLTHFPVGTLRQRFLPQGTGESYEPSPLMSPFIDAGLRQDMSVFYGFSDGHLSCPNGGGHEAGTPFTTTGCSAEGTRQNGGEGDDGVAGGPSFDQIFLANVPDLARDGVGYANAICDARVDSNETSTQCLSYSYTQRSIAAARGGNISEHTPLLPQLSPAQLYASLFSGFMPGGNTEANREAALKGLRMRKSVLDFSLTELNELQRLAPAAERPKLDLHAEAIRKVESQLASQIESGELDGEQGVCMLPAEPPRDLAGQKGNSQYLENVGSDDSEVHKAVIEAHTAVLLAAFQCDLIRVGTFQFSPGTNHVSFKGMWPSDPNRIAMHHPVSHAGSFLGGASDADPSGLAGADVDRYEFLANVQTWYNQRLADFLVKLKLADDGFGGNLLDTMVVPYVTEVGQSNHTRSGKPAYLFGGSKLGLRHGSFRRFQDRAQVDLFLSCAQALLQTDDPKGGLEAERFNQFNRDCQAIEGLWSPV